MVVYIDFQPTQLARTHPSPLEVEQSQTDFPLFRT